MRLNYSQSPDLYLDFLRSNFTASPSDSAIPVSILSSPDTLRAIYHRQVKLLVATSELTENKPADYSRS